MRVAVQVTTRSVTSPSSPEKSHRENSQRRATIDAMLQEFGENKSKSNPFVDTCAWILCLAWLVLQAVSWFGVSRLLAWLAGWL